MELIKKLKFIFVDLYANVSSNIMRYFILLLFFTNFYQSNSQTMDWAVNDNFDNFSYGKIINRIDGNDNVYFCYSTTPEQYDSIEYYIEKYTTEGQKDLSFGLNGILNLTSLFSLSNDKTLITFDITDDDKLLFLTAEGEALLYNNLYFERLNDDGTLDLNFGVSGVKHIYTDEVKYNTHFNPKMIKVDGKYFILNNYKNNLDAQFAEISCFDDSGELFTNTFNQGNLEINYGLNYAYSELTKIAHTNNHIYVVGTGNNIIDEFDQFVSRVDLSTGLLDTNYGNNGYLLFNDKSADLFQYDGKIIELKSIYGSPAQQDIRITRYLSNGTIDSTYGTNGIVTLTGDFRFYSNPMAYNLPNNDVFIHVRLAAFASDRDVVVYLKNSGEIDITFGGNITDNGFPILGTYGLPTFKSNPGWLSFGQDYFIVSSRRMASPRSIRTTKVNYDFETLSINELQLNSFYIYPNPTNYKLNIDCNTAFKTIHIYNVEGRLLNTIMLNNSLLNFQLDVSNLSEGIYFIQINADNLKQTQKFIIN